MCSTWNGQQNRHCMALVVWKTLDEPHIRTYPSKYPYVKNICPYLSNLELARLIAKKSCRHDKNHVGIIFIMPTWFLSCRHDFYHADMIFCISQRYEARSHKNPPGYVQMHGTTILFTITTNSPMMAAARAPDSASAQSRPPPPSPLLCF